MANNYYAVAYAIASILGFAIGIDAEAVSGTGTGAGRRLVHASADPQTMYRGRFSHRTISPAASLSTVARKSASSPTRDNAQSGTLADEISVGRLALFQGERTEITARKQVFRQERVEFESVPPKFGFLAKPLSEAFRIERLQRRWG